MNITKLINLIKDLERISFNEMDPKDTNHFYMFQKPQHLIDAIGNKRWNELLDTYPEYFGFPTTIAERWEYLIPEHIENSTILDIGCNIGVELYNILKYLNPKKIIAIDNNQTSLDFFKLCMEDFNYLNLEYRNIDVIKSYDKKLDEQIDVITCMGRILSYRSDQNEDLWRLNINLFFKYIKLQNPKYFYFMANGKKFIEEGEKFFGVPATIIDTKNTRFNFCRDNNKNYLYIKARYVLENFGYFKFK
jgi:hypothetical protein